jgi:hypothetical protein
MMAESPLTPVASDSVPLDPSRTMAKGGGLLGCVTKIWVKMAENG